MIWVGIFFFWTCVFFQDRNAFAANLHLHLPDKYPKISRSPRGDGDEEEKNSILVRKWWMKPGFDYLEDGLPVDGSVVRITSVDISYWSSPHLEVPQVQGDENDHHGLKKPLTLYNWDDSPSSRHSSVCFTGRWTGLIQVLVGKDNPSLKKLPWLFFWRDFFVFVLFRWTCQLGYCQHHPTKRGCGALHAASTMKERTGGGCPRKGATVFSNF